MPGGGVEEGEELLEALRREVLEEIGCTIQNIQELAVVEEYRNKFSLHQFSHCYVAQVEGEMGSPALTESELADGFETVWLPIDQAIETLKSESGVEDYQGKFIQKRDRLFLKEVKKLL